MGSERRGSLIQNTGFGAYTNGMAFAGMGQQRNPLVNPNPMNRSQEQSRITSPSGQGMGRKLQRMSGQGVGAHKRQHYRHQDLLYPKDRMAPLDRTSL